MTEPLTDSTNDAMALGPSEAHGDRSAPLKERPFATTPATDWNHVAQLATFIGRSPAALLVHAPSGVPEVLGACGLPAETVASAAARCVQIATEIDSPLRDTGALPALWNDPAQPDIRFCRLLVLPLKAGQPTTWLALLDRTLDGTGPDTVMPGLQALLAHAAHLLERASQHDQQLQQAQRRQDHLDTALHESESRLNLTEHTAGVGSWSVDIATGQMQHSGEFASILGLLPHERITDLTSMVQRCMPEWRTGIQQHLERCAQTGEPFDEETQVQVPGANPKWVRTVGKALRDGEGHILRIQGALQDIAAQKHAQQETLRLAMRLTTTLASITEAFVTLDRQCCFTYLNQESERLLQ